MDITEEKINTDDDLVIKKSRGRPKKEPKEVTPKIPQKPGPKTDASKHKEYYAEYYRNHYSNIYLNCPNCFKLVQKNKICRHMRTDRCMVDQMSKKYITQDFEKIIEQNKEKFDKYFETFLKISVDNEINK